MVIIHLQLAIDSYRYQVLKPLFWLWWKWTSQRPPGRFSRKVGPPNNQFFFHGVIHGENPPGSGWVKDSPQWNPLFVRVSYISPFITRLVTGPTAGVRRDGIPSKNHPPKPIRLTSDPKEFAPIWLQQDIGGLRNPQKPRCFATFVGTEAFCQCRWKPEFKESRWWFTRSPLKEWSLRFFLKLLSSRKCRVTLLPGQQGLHLYKSRGGGRRSKNSRGNSSNFGRISSSTRYDKNHLGSTKNATMILPADVYLDANSWSTTLTTTGVMNAAFSGVRTFI